MSGLTEEEQDRLCDALVDYTANRAAAAPDRFEKHLLPAVERIVAERERAAQVRALREAADDWESLVQREKPPIRGSIWLRDRADRLEDES